MKVFVLVALLAAVAGGQDIEDVKRQIISQGSYRYSLSDGGDTVFVIIDSKVKHDSGAMTWYTFDVDEAVKPLTALWHGVCDSLLAAQKLWPYTPAELLAALHAWRHVTGEWPMTNAATWSESGYFLHGAMVNVICADTACQWREVRP